MSEYRVQYVYRTEHGVPPTASGTWALNVDGDALDAAESVKEIVSERGPPSTEDIDIAEIERVGVGDE